MRLAACFAVVFTILLCMTACAMPPHNDWLDSAMYGQPYDNRDKLMTVNSK